MKKTFTKYVWDIPNTEKKVYLTFDDGPTPEITEWVLNQLNQYGAKATFFCVGENIQKFPDIFRLILSNGHVVGNHTFNHFKGWKKRTSNYIRNVDLCEEAIIQNSIFENDSSTHDSLSSTKKLFRPPYGKIRSSQANILLKKNYTLIMWDVLSADFDHGISPEKCLENVTSNIQPGSIVVFHDGFKAFRNLEFVLPKVLTFLKEKDYVCEVID